MNAELYRVAGQLERAHQAEEVFGELNGAPSEQAANLKKAFHRLAKIAHPDAYLSPADQVVAQAAFHRLMEWHTRAVARLQAGVYGSLNPMSAWRVALHTAKRTYVLDRLLAEGPLYAGYSGSFEEDGQTCAVQLKIVRNPGDNDLAENEARTLQALYTGKAAKKFGNYLPHLLDAFLYEEDGDFRQVNVFEQTPGWVPLTDVRRAYPRGVDPQEMAWIWRRVLVALGFAHLNGRIHGAVLPCNIEILPELHGLRLVEWSSSVGWVAPPGDPVGECLVALNPAYEHWYPAEVQRGEPPLPGTDIDMAARCMIDLLGGDPVRQTLPATVPPALRAFFRGCTLPGKRSRPQDAWTLKGEFEDLIGQLWGELKFHPFMLHPENL